LFPQKFKNGTAVILPAARGLCEPEKFRAPGTFLRFMHPKEEGGGFDKGFDSFGFPTYVPAELIQNSLLHRTSFNVLP
jgi:hypothetical protein